MSKHPSLHLLQRCQRCPTLSSDGHHEQEVRSRAAVLLGADIQPHVRDKSFRRRSVLHGVPQIPVQLSDASQHDRVHLAMLSPHIRVYQPCQLSLRLDVHNWAVRVCTWCSASNLAVRCVTMFVSSMPVRFAISTMRIAMSSMADIAAHSRPGSRRDRRSTTHRELQTRSQRHNAEIELSCQQSKPASTLAP